MKKIILEDYYYHGLINHQNILSIFNYGILSRRQQRKEKFDNFSSNKDFLEDTGSNGLDYVSISKYDTLSFYIYSLPNITIILNKNVDIMIKENLIDGEFLVKDKIDKEKIIGIGCLKEKLSLQKYSKQALEYIFAIKYIYDIKKDIPIYDLKTGNLIDKNTIETSFKCLKIKKDIKILLISNKYSGQKNVIDSILNDYGISVYNLKFGIKKEDNYIKKKKQFIKLYDEIKNTSGTLLFTASLLDYKPLFLDFEWKKLLKTLNITENMIKKEYDVVIHLNTMLFNYKKYYDKPPKLLNDIYKQDIYINKMWNKHKNYYEIRSKDSIIEKINEVKKILDIFI